MRRRPVLVAGVLMAAVWGMQVLAQGSYSFFVGTGSPAAGTRDGLAAEAQFNFGAGDLVGMVRDSANHVIVSDTNNSVLRRISPAGVVATFAPSAGLSSPLGLAIDSADNVYVADTGNRRVVRITAGGVATTLASDPALKPSGLVVLSDGTVFVSSSENHTIARITSGGVLSTIAGNPGFGGSTDGTGTAARFQSPGAMTLDPATGDLLVSDGDSFHGHRIRRVTQAGAVTTVALPGGEFVSAPAQLVFDPDGRLFISDRRNITLGVFGVVGSEARIRVLVNGTLYPVSGGYPPGNTVIRGFLRESSGTLLLADMVGHTIYRATIADAGTLAAPGPFSLTYVPFASRPLACDAAAPADGSRLVMRFCDVISVAVGRDGTQYIADASYSFELGSGIQSTRGFSIRKVTPAGESSTLAGTLAGPGSTDGAGSVARFGLAERSTRGVLGLAVNADGVVFVADQGNSSIRRVAADGTTTTFAGVSGSPGATDGSGSAARFNRPHDVAMDSAGNLFVADTGNSSIRKVSPAGAVTTFAGTSGAGGSTDGTGTAARFSAPYAIAVGPNDTVYVADTGNHVIRKITSAGVVTTLAGTAGVAGTADGLGTAATFNTPRSIAVDQAGTVYVGDRPQSSFAWRIRRISAAGQVTTISGVSVSSTKYGDVTDVDAVGTLYLPYGPTVVVGTTAGATGAAPAFTTQPASQTVTTGQPVTFTVASSGAPTPLYRWQTSVDAGVTWTDLTDAAPYSGSSTSTLSVSTTTLTYPLRRFRATATNAFGSATSNAATLTVPGLLVQPTSLRFRVVKTGSAIRSHPVQELLATFVAATPGTITWSANQPWVHVTPLSSGAPGVNVDILDFGNVLGSSTSASAVITASASGVAAVQIPLSLEIMQNDAPTAAPVGQVDTPTQDATGVRGAIALSGWAIDDIGVVSVLIYRNCLATEPQANCQVGVIPGRNDERVVELGEAQLVPGARPDVEAAFPQYPGNRAGWGFLILSNMLPRSTGTFAPYGGQGPVTLYAVAYDTSSNRTLLGRSWMTDATPTTVTLDNDAITKPFGTLDTPAQGERVTSANLNNFGWVLTPDTDTVQGPGDIEMANASGLVLFIDGMPVSAVTYNQCRGTVGNPVPAGVYCNDDIANIFGNPAPAASLTPRTSNPTRYRNLDAGRGAIGALQVFVGGLFNGLHTIAWSATDSAGRVEGIGSRYFSVSHPQLGPASDPASASKKTPDVFSETGGVWARPGFDLSSPFAELTTTDDTIHRVRIAELGRVELWLGAPVASGAMVSGAASQALPAGSHLDPATGHFTWMPGPGFIGAYRLAFQRGDARVDVEVTIEPAREVSSTESEIRMDDLLVTDTAVTGRAHDPRAFAGHGIGSVHMWGLRRDVPTAVPVFLGTADIAADGTYTFGTSLLERGMWDVTAYVWNIRTARFEDARTSRVTVR